MMRHVLVFLFGLVLSACGQAAEPSGYKLGERLAPSSSKAAPAYREITWEELTPKGWDPMGGFKIQDFAKLQDGDRRANELMRKLRDAWSKAPAVPELDKQAVRIPGFLVPLDAERDQLREFLLVPYFGACIHTPPPPANQTIHVIMNKPFKGRMMEPFWISGVLQVTHSDSPFGAAAYTLRGQRSEIYQTPARR